MNYNRSAVCLVNQDKILLIYRKKDNKEFYVVPGGTMEENETPEITAVRELKEEASIDVKLDKLLWTYGDEISYCHYFLSSSFTGKVKFGGEELLRNCVTNQYELHWITFSDLENIVLYPIEIHKRIIKYFKS